MLKVSLGSEVSVFSLSRRSFLQRSQALNICFLIIFPLHPLSINHPSKSLQGLSKLSLSEQILLSPRA